MSRVSIISHARARAEERGVSESEIKQTVLGGIEFAAKAGRKAKEKIFGYHREWLGREYEQKKVQVIYLETGEEIIVITVKAFYGRFGEEP